ncbi:MAG: Tellurite resistance protein TerB [Alkalinema sp. CACIAM 70d]|nr:MAG: Tellurite resistance protein TerB [Alkalinema sp. CACIAM 70d]
MVMFDAPCSLPRPIPITLSPAEAFAAITIVAISSDGYLADEEIDTITASLARMHLFRTNSTETMRCMYDKLFGIMRRDGITVLLQAAKESLPFELREAAFAVATDLVLADGMMTQDEQLFLNELCKILEIAKETASKIVEVMMIKSRG